MSVAPDYRLLRAFESAFNGKKYLHRNSSIGNQIALELYEDLYEIGRSQKLSDRIDKKRCVINVNGDLTGIVSRRADGTFGQRNPSAKAINEPGFIVARSHLATTEIGVEVKILAKAMIKQIGRVDSDLREQVSNFKKGGKKAISLGLVGVNHADHYVSFEGDRPYPTDGTSRFRHPSQEAPAAEERLARDTKPKFDEFLFLRFKATNAEPFLFEWLNRRTVLLEYGAVLARISSSYDARF